MSVRKTELSKFLKNTDLRIKQWIYDNPKVGNAVEFEQHCDYHWLIGTARFCDIRKVLIKKLQPWERDHKQFAMRATGGKHTAKIARLRTFIEHHRKFTWEDFQRKNLLSGNRADMAFAKTISKRSFDKNRKEMVNSGEIIDKQQNIAAGFFDRSPP